MNPLPVSRRAFLKVSTLASGALVVGLTHPRTASAQDSKPILAWEPNLYIRIDPTGLTTLISKNPEGGQGINTAMPMVVAEFLNADWNSVRVEQAPLDDRYGRQLAAASGSTPDGWDDLRIAGAGACHMLQAAAAQQWGVSADECIAKQGFIIHPATGRKLGYGTLAPLAAQQPVPSVESLSLKNRPEEFNLLGTSVRGVDNHKIITGQPLFGSDIRLEGMLYAVFAKCPAFGGHVRSANLELIRRQPGVLHAFVIEGGTELRGLLSGVAIVAETWWQAHSARKLLQVDWDSSNQDSSADYETQAAALKEQGGRTIREDGNLEAGFDRAYRVLEADYSYPFVAHANMEPQNCTAFYDDSGRMEVWAPTQDPATGRKYIAQTLGISPAKIKVNLTRMGGGFGRRLNPDFMVEVAAIAKTVKRPVQLQWTREDDFQHDFYRPAAWNHFKAGVDQQGRLIAWDHHFITFGQDGRTARGANFAPDNYPAGLTPNFRLRRSLIPCAVPTGPWRAPGHSAHCWAFQSFFDELAEAAAIDPLQFRRQLLERAHGPQPLDLGRTRATLETAATNAGWGRNPGPGRGMGIAFHYDHGGFMTFVAEASGDASGQVTIDKVFACIDVGPIINRSGANNQVEGCIMDALSTAQGEITFAHGAAQQNNFTDYPLLRINQAPAIEIEFLQGDSRPAGLGEVIAAATPAMTSAICAATGNRIRKLPLQSSGITVI